MSASCCVPAAVNTDLTVDEIRFQSSQGLNFSRIVETWNLKVSKLNIYFETISTCTSTSLLHSEEEKRFQSFPLFREIGNFLMTWHVQKKQKFFEKINLASSCACAQREGTTNDSCTNFILRLHFFWKLLKLKLHKAIICFCKLGEVIWTETQIKAWEFCLK